MTTEDERELAEAIEDAVATFDAANFAWGQFYQHTWLQRSEAERALAQPVREALGDAALSVPQKRAQNQAQIFLTALLEARWRLLAFLTELGPRRPLTFPRSRRRCWRPPNTWRPSSNIFV